MESLTARVVMLSIFIVSFNFIEKFPAFEELPKSSTNFSSPDARTSFIVAFKWVELEVEFIDDETFSFCTM
jgi:hypothetical protein